MRARYAILATFFLTLPIAAERPKPIEIEIDSKFVGERRRVIVSLPGSYTSGSERYPVLVLPDSELHLAHTVASADALAAVARMPELIIVAIPNTNRRRDLTPTQVEGPASSGGAKRFGDFIASEVIPAVERRYRTHPYRMLAGHSLGGLFVLEMLFTRPTLFDAWIVVSPSTFWDEDYIIRRAATLSEPYVRAETVFLMSADEDSRIVDGVGRLRDAMLKREIPNLEILRYELRDDDHLTAPIAGFYTGLRVSFRPWFFRIDDADDADALYPRAKDHYRRVTEKYGFEVPIPEGRFERIARRLLEVGKVGEAIAVLREFIAVYPASASARELLALAHKRSATVPQHRD